MLQVVKKPSYLTGIIHLINEESAKLFVMALINIEILTSRELLYTKLARVISLCFVFVSGAGDGCHEFSRSDIFSIFRLISPFESRSDSFI